MFFFDKHGGLKPQEFNENLSHQGSLFPTDAVQRSSRILSNFALLAWKLL